MDINIFTTIEEFIFTNLKLIKNTKCNLYRSESYEHPYNLMDGNDPISWSCSESRSLSLLIGKAEDEHKILKDKQINIPRACRVGFVDIRYGGEDEHAIGASHYGADTSTTAKFINRELKKILKEFAHKGVIDCADNEIKSFFWTDAALATEKNWHRFLSRGAKKYTNMNMNMNMGYRPLRINQQE